MRGDNWVGLTCVPRLRQNSGGNATPYNECGRIEKNKVFTNCVALCESGQVSGAEWVGSGASGWPRTCAPATPWSCTSCCWPTWRKCFTASAACCTNLGPGALCRTAQTPSRRTSSTSVSWLLLPLLSLAHVIIGKAAPLLCATFRLAGSMQRSMQSSRISGLSRIEVFRPSVSLKKKGFVTPRK